MCALASACSSSSKCDCPDRALLVHVPDDRATQVIDVVATGAACAGVAATCAQSGASGACTVYRIAPSATGGCHVDVDFAMGAARFSADARIVNGSGCCGGVVADPPSAQDIDIPSASDAGAIG
jgi:hypothetical protein